ncbi:REV7 (YIL139C) [Zygosaccharomyces parabailii]|nr:REV7 (YIL139C) [Zygosaccharomyces parabailii]CDH08561.1 probable DNA polymerase zeta processivity subunit [Zygosaccharomyces bailii ISA1307]
MNIWIEKWIKIYLKCIINLILYKRNIYPPASFDITTYQAFNLPQFTPINRHPQLQDYIEELIRDLLEKLVHIYGIGICVVAKENDICIERYVLRFDEFQHVDNVGVLSEAEVFDEFRSSLNSLMRHLEKQPPIKDNTVTFEVIINTLEMQLGHKGYEMEPLRTLEDKLAFDRNMNWTKCEEDEGFPDPEDSKGIYRPKIKMTSLVGCDVGPLIIRNHSERLVVADDTLDSIYQSTQEPSLNSFP